MKPQIIVQENANKGFHNSNPDTHARIMKGNTYRDQSTICVIPTRGMIPAKVVQSWMGMINPMNQKFTRFMMIGMEVGEAYSSAIDQILANPELSKWKYILTLEEDNAPPPDGLLKLIESIEGGVNGKKYDVMSGIYWTKGHGGQPMIYGNPKAVPKDFIPFWPSDQERSSDPIVEANGLGMGFNLFRMSMFKDPRLAKPLFKTQQEYRQGVGTTAFSQDLYFYNNAGALGYRFACDTRVQVGHYDYENDFMW